MNKHYEEMIVAVGALLTEMDIKYSEEGGCFRALEESEHGFFGSLVVDPGNEHIAILEALPMPVPEEKREELIFAMNAVNERMAYGKFYVAPMTDETGEIVYRGLYELCVRVPSGAPSKQSVQFLIENSIAEIVNFGNSLLHVINGEHSAVYVINELGEF